MNDWHCGTHDEWERAGHLNLMVTYLYGRFCDAHILHIVRDICGACSNLEMNAIFTEVRAR
jgi:hypothetical protein